ncbi:MAG: GNAT family N-acetyltransferase, partial [Akkermansiaceae bacterium]|nr:GNAT family N-acetyltransferase [Armatimonadota bacterium]
LAALSDDAHAEYLAFDNRLRAESHPDDPPRTLEAHLARQRSIPTFLEIHHWEIRDTAIASNLIVGFASLQIAHQEENRHIASFDIDVLPERRHEGIASRLLHPLAVAASEKGRTLLMSHTHDRTPAGETFLRSIGAEPGLHSHTNQLVLPEIDPAFLKGYREEGEKRGNGDFELIRCQSPIPEELLVSAVELGNMVARDIPRGDLTMEQEQYTPEQIREMDRMGMASGATMLALIAKERSSGTFVGMTTMTWRSHTPYVAEQGITGVLPEYRGRGLARTLKAVMLEQLMESYPQVRFVRTDNADSNAAMLAINNALGFRPYRSEIHWQVPTERVLTYFAG